MSDTLQVLVVGTVLAFVNFTLCFTLGIPTILGFVIYGVIGFLLLRRER